MKRQKIDVLTIGEIVMDLLTEEMVDSMENATRYHRYFGGSPANIGVNVAQLGFDSAIISRVGSDPFGRYALNFLAEKGMETTGVQIDDRVPTTTIFVGRTTGTPEVIHYRGADQRIAFTEEARILIDQARFIHFSGFALSRSPSREALQEMKAYAIKQGKWISFDPCFHAPLWEDPSEGRIIFENFIQDVEIVKPSLDDLTRLWGEIEPLEGIQRYHQLGAKHVVLTLGKEGVWISDGQKIFKYLGQSLTVQDATGAGDSFWSGLYGGLLLGKSLKEAVGYGMQTAAITIQHRGAIAPLPPITHLKEQVTDQGETA